MRIVVALPAKRLWRWHLPLIAALEAAGHAVTIRLWPGPPYPLALRFLMHVEAIAFGRPEWATPAMLAEFAVRTFGNDDIDLLIDLAGEAERSRRRRLIPSFDGEPGEAALFGALLEGRSPVMAVRDANTGVRLAQSYPAVDDREVLLRALQSVFSRQVALILRAVQRMETGAPVEVWTEPPPSSPEASWATAAVVRFAAREAVRKAKRQFAKPFWQDGQWTLATRTSGGVHPWDGLSGFAQLDPAPDGYIADPFLHDREGRTTLFAETVPPGSDKGVLVSAERRGDGGWAPFETCLERPYHLSYPQVFDHDGETWMLPETSRNRTLELYRCTDYPREWTLDRVLMEDVSLADATLFEHEGRWWLLAARTTFGGSSQDELVGFHAPSPFGPWTPHSMDPLKSDARSARPGGRVIHREGRFYRPAQNCLESYGAGLVWCEILELTPTTFRERVITHWDGADFGANGVHTFAEGGGVEVIDLKRRVRRR